MQKIIPCLWFNNNCEEAVNFYTSIFPHSKITSILRYPDGAQEGPLKGMDGKILTADFELDGLGFQALDGGPTFTMNPSVSFMVNFDPSREDNAEQRLNEMWAKLSEGGRALMELDEYPFSKRYGWIQDRFGVSWQLILTDADGEPRPSIIPSWLFVGDVCGRAEEAIKYYTSVFQDSKMGIVAPYPAGMEPNKAGTAMFAEAQLAGQWFTAMDSALMHQFGFNEGISFSIDCQDQAEVDYFWNEFTKDGQESQCGWVKDKFGFSWQIVPKHLGEMLLDPDKDKSYRVLQAMMQMQKLDVAELQRAYDEV